jgi:structural maintenance of chromosome 1
MISSMDAISFVLGIKSSHLRSTHLRDLVYRGRVLRHSTINDDGSASRPGMNGHANGEEGSDIEESQDTQRERNDPKSAWVMAVYEDDAGDEQQWKRSITNQGVSEYRINNRVVTAQQYNAALEAESILIKARNFLVFQGDIEAVASQSPKDLTRLIEQISGSLDFKAEYERLKAESEQAAEQQTFQLNRRRGINSEIKQYQQQKAEVDNYERKKDEHDQAVITHILWKMYHFQRQIDESTAEIQRHQEELKEYRRGVEKHERNLEGAKKEHAGVGRDVGKAERAIKRKEKEIEDKSNSLVPVDEKIEVTNKKLQRYAGRIGEITKEQTSQANGIKQHEKDLKTVEKAQTQWDNDWKKTMEKKGAQLSEDDFQEYKKLKEDVNRKSSANQIKLDNLKRQRRAEEETVNSLKSKVESTEWQLKTLETEMDTISERKANTSRVVKETSKEMDGKKKELNSLTSERLRVTQNRTELEEKLQEVLKKLVEADDGRKQNDKEIRMKEMISNLKRIFPGVKGRVSDLCKPKEKKYSDAVSTVLGRHFDAVVVDNEKTAKECIQHLRDQREGQATFIPIGTIQTKTVSPTMRSLHAKMRPAIDVIEFDNDVKRAIDYACGNAMVCDDLATAKYLCYEKNIDAKAVTLDGTVIHKAGLMTGGRGPGEKNSRRWGDAEVESLRKMQDKLLRDIQALPQGHRRGTAEETLQGELAGLEQRSAYAREELKGFDRNLESKAKEVDFAKRQLSDSKPKYQKAQRELQELDENIKEFQDEVSSVEDKIFQAFCQRLGYDDIREYEARQGSLQQEAAQKKLEFTTQKSRVENMLSFERQRLESTQDRIKALQAQEQRDRTMIAELEAERETVQSEIDTLNAELEQLQEQLEEQKSAHEKTAEKLAAYRREVQKRSKNIEATLKSISSLEGDVQQSSKSRYALLRRCKLEDIELPLTEESESLDKLPIDDMVQAEDTDEAMDVDEDPSSSALQLPVVQDYGIDVAFDDLADDLKEVCSSPFTSTHAVY